MAELFREKPLQELAPSERYDQLVRVISPKAWWLVSAVCILFLTLIIWTSQLEVSQKISVPGILMTGRLTLVSNPLGGRIETITVKEGMPVSAGKLLASLENAELVQGQRSAALKLAKAQQNQRDSSLGTGFKAADDALAFANEEMDFWNRRLAESRELRSPVSGKIIEIRKEVGDSLAAEEPLLVLEEIREPSSMAGYAFLPLEQKSFVHEGMSCNIRVINQDLGRTQTFPATVTQVSSYPVSQERLTRLLLNRKLVSIFSRNGAPYLVQIRLLPEAFEALTSVERVDTGLFFDLEIKSNTRALIDLVLPLPSRDDHP